MVFKIQHIIPNCIIKLKTRQILYRTPIIVKLGLTNAKILNKICYFFELHILCTQHEIASRTI